MINFQMLSTKEADEWKETLKSSVNYDFYHLPGYHILAEERGEGIAHLFVFREDQYMIALPLLFRPIQMVPGLDKKAKGLWDATSVYGYAGPVFSHTIMPDNVIKNFQLYLHKYLLKQNIVTVFSRLHTFIPQSNILHGLGAVSVVGVTISIDLTLPLEKQKSQYSKGHKSGLNKLRELGVECYHDEKLEYLDDFIQIYYETMRRVKAERYYFFSKAYFEKLIASLGAEVHHFMCTFKDKIVCSGLYIRCNDIVQSHLGGTRNEFFYMAPRKLEKDTVRLWAVEQGARIFHLGGGVGAKRDSLYEFKAGFSKNRHDFNVWKWVVNPDVYYELCHEINPELILKQSGYDLYDTSFFPVYRNNINS